MEKISRDELREYALGYVALEGDGCVVAPQLYSPFYVRLYQSLIDGVEPPLPNDFNFDDVSEDFKACNTSFDRYLVATFGSRYELSHPIPLTEEQANPEALSEYLVARYRKASDERDSFNFDRVKKDVLSLLPKAIKTDFEKHHKKEYRSFFYKLLTIGYKLSLINRQWRSRVRRSKATSQRLNQLDDVIAFNDLDEQQSRENTAIFMTLYYELTQASPDGSSNFSRLIPLIPTALNMLEQAIEKEVKTMWCDGYDSEEISEEINEQLLLAKKVSAKWACSDYDDPNHKMCDTFSTVILKNDFHNKLLAKRKFEQNIAADNAWAIALETVYENSQGLLASLSDDERSVRVSQALSINAEDIDSEIIEASKVISMLMQDRVERLSQHVCENLSLLMVSAIKFELLPTYIKGSLTGANNQSYHLNNVLTASVKRVLDKRYKDWQLETAFRPSLIQFFKFSFEYLLWRKEGTVKGMTKFMALRSSINQVQVSVSDELEAKHHYETLLICEDFAQKQNLKPFVEDDNNSERIQKILMQFWKESDLEIVSLHEHLQSQENRIKYTWRCNPPQKTGH